MNNAVTVKVVQSVHQLLGDLANLRLAKVTIIFKNLKELSLRKLRHDAELMRSFK